MLLWARVFLVYEKFLKKYNGATLHCKTSLLKGIADMMKKQLTRKIVLVLAAGMLTVGTTTDAWAAAVTSLPGTDGDWKKASPLVSTAKWTPSSGSSNNVITLTLNGETELNSFAGGVQTNKTKANNNTVTINAQGATVTNSVGIYGAASDVYATNDVTNNTVTINGGTFENINGIYGAWDCYGSMKNNKVELNGVTVDTFTGRLVGGGAWVGYASENTVLIKDCTMENADVTIFGGFTAADAESNIVTIDNSTYKSPARDIYGAYAKYEDQEVLENKIYIKNNSEVVCDWIMGGHAGSQGSVVDKNLVSITDSTVTARRIYGGGQGYEYESDAMSTIKNNEVSIVDATLKARTEEGLVVAGGYTSNEGNVELYDNTVTISNAHMDEASDIILYGAIARYTNADGTGYDNNPNATIANNTLNIIGTGWTGRTTDIANFATINFKDLAWENEGIVSRTDNLALDESGTTVNVTLSADSTVKQGDYMTLIQSDNTTGTLIAGETPTITAGTSVAEAIEGEILQEGHDIVLRFGEEPVLNEQVQVIGESRAAATAFVNQSSELIENNINAMICEERIGHKTFASIYGNASKYKTNGYFNEHIRVNGWSGNVGIGETTENGLTYGIFFETGTGNYRTYSRANGIFMRGDGEVNYRGGGILARKDNRNGLYTEASFHIGDMDNELNNALLGKQGLTGYDVNTTYYGAHLGIGKIIEQRNGDTLDIYGKFLYTHHGGKTFAIEEETFSFDSINSKRLRLGVRYNDHRNNKTRMYYGAAWEYEFDGDATNTVLDYELYTPSLGGSSIIGEIGMHYNADPKWCLDLNLRGYGGQRQGVGTSLHINYLF